MFDFLDLFVECPMCGENSVVTVLDVDFEKWQDGELCQNAFPYLNATDREVLISHLCPKCQARIFGA